MAQEHHQLFTLCEVDARGKLIPPFFCIFEGKSSKELDIIFTATPESRVSGQVQIKVADHRNLFNVSGAFFELR